ncbi:hypothetical protein OAV88_02885 [bacterium]|nr:hypothetical protein [bacterium]
MASGEFATEWTTTQYIIYILCSSVRTSMRRSPRRRSVYIYVLCLIIIIAAHHSHSL